MIIDGVDYTPKPLVPSVIARPSAPPGFNVAREGTSGAGGVGGTSSVRLARCRPSRCRCLNAAPALRRRVGSWTRSASPCRGGRSWAAGRSRKWSVRCARAAVFHHHSRLAHRRPRLHARTRPRRHLPSAFGPPCSPPRPRSGSPGLARARPGSPRRGRRRRRRATRSAGWSRSPPTCPSRCSWRRRRRSHCFTIGAFASPRWVGVGDGLE